MSRMVALGLLIAPLLMAAAIPAWAAAPDDPGVLDRWSVGGGALFFGRERVYHATTACREVNYRNCNKLMDRVPAGETQTANPPHDTVEISRSATSSLQVLLDYQPFGGSGQAAAPFSLARANLFVITSYGFQAENRRLIEGFGLGYSLLRGGEQPGHTPWKLDVGWAWIDEVQVRSPGVRQGHDIPLGDANPTRRVTLSVPMITLTIGLN